MSFPKFSQIQFCLSLSAIAFVAAGWANAAAADETLSLDQAIALAEKQAPQLTAQDAAVRAAANEAIRAPQLPDPQLIAGIENLPVDTGDRFSLTRDFMTMRKIGVEQMFPRKEKRRLRGAAAEADVQKEQASLATERLNVQHEVVVAWIERYVAERQRDLLVELRDESQLLATTTRAALKGGKGSSSDVLAVDGDRLQLDDRLDVAKRDVEQAQADLARWVGTDAASRPLADPPDFTELRTAPGALLENVGSHAALQTYTAMEARAEADVALARAEKKPDWSVEVAYAQRGPTYSNMLSVEFRVDLPLFTTHRQDPAIAAKFAELDRVRAERESAEREHRNQTAKLLSVWTSAQKRIARSIDELLPLARQRVQTSLAAYRGGGDLQAVISARKAEIDARTTYITQLDELARSWAALNSLVADKE